MIIRKLALPLLCSAILLLQGCAAWQVNQMAAALPSAGPAATLDRLEKLQVSDRDRAQFLLNTGILKLYLGDWSASRQDLETAKAIMESSQAVSITENVAALTTNETLRVYNGTPTDRVLVHVMLALDYLMADDLDGARVEILQADVTMKTLAETSGSSGQLASAAYVAGVIYELNGEYDDALISYRRAYNILTERKEDIPSGLQVSLLNLTKRQGFPKEYKDFAGRFGREAELPGTGEGEWFLFYFDGVVSNKTESRISLYNAEVQTTISVVMPHYLPSLYQPRFMTLVAADRERSGIVENLEVRAREDLADQRAKLLATATARAVAKYNMVQNTKKQSDMGGLLMNIAAVASEQADVRSWNMLPASLQVARGKASLTQPVTLAEQARTLPPLAAFARGGRAVVLTSSLTDALYGWPPLPATAEAESAAPTELSESESNAITTNASQGEPHAMP